MNLKATYIFFVPNVQSVQSVSFENNTVFHCLLLAIKAKVVYQPKWLLV